VSRHSEGKKRVLQQIQGTNMDATGGLLRSATDEAARAEEGRERQELRLQQFGERGERELAKFVTLRAALLGPALKSFIKLQGGLAGHTAASMNDFRKLHLNVPNVLQVLNPDPPWRRAPLAAGCEAALLPCQLTTARGPQAAQTC
jgi:hypothetical protein